MNINDIAEKTGYSIATVSRAINSSGYVSEKARKKIMKVIEEEGFSVNPFAKGMATSSMKLAGILSTDSRDLYQAECIYHLQEELRQNGFTALLCCTGMNLADKKEGISLLLSRKVDAIFLIGSQFVEDSARDNEYLKKAAKQVPVIMMNGFLEMPNVYSIRCDDFRGEYELTRAALQGGSHQPAMLVRRFTFSSREKIRGFLAACQEAGLDPESPDIVEADDFQTGLPAILDALFERTDCDALICSDDQLAVRALKYCQRRGIQVPEQIQITGYNGSSLARMTAVEISSYDNRIPYLCTTSVSCMKAILDKKDYPNETVYTGQLTLRDSTGSDTEL